MIWLRVCVRAGFPMRSFCGMAGGPKPQSIINIYIYIHTYIYILFRCVCECGLCAGLCRSWMPSCSFVSLINAFLHSSGAHKSVCPVLCCSWKPSCVAYGAVAHSCVGCEVCWAVLCRSVRTLFNIVLEISAVFCCLWGLSAVLCSSWRHSCGCVFVKGAFSESCVVDWCLCAVLCCLWTLLSSLVLPMEAFASHVSLMTAFV